MKRRRRFSVLNFAIILIRLVAFYVAIATDGSVGRRAVCQLRYYLDFRYWSNWVSFALWLIACALASYSFLTRADNQEKIRARLEKSDLTVMARLPRKRYGLIAILFFALVAMITLLGATLNFRAMWRFVRYNLYGEYFQRPIAEFVNSGEFDVKLLLGPALILAAVAIAWLVKKRRGTLLALLVGVSSVAFAGASARADLATAPETQGKRIQIVANAEYDSTLNPEIVSETASVKNQDGGYDANDAIVKCFAQAVFVDNAGTGRARPIPFRLRVPTAVEPGKKYPVLIWFGNL